MSYILDLTSNLSLLSQLKGMQPLPREERKRKEKHYFPEMCDNCPCSGRLFPEKVLCRIYHVVMIFMEALFKKNREVCGGNVFENSCTHALTYEG